MTAPRSIEFRSVPDPVIEPGKVLVRVQAAGLCTWEQKFWHGVPGSYPFIGGHEICGTVVVAGSGVAQTLAPGDCVVVASLTRCGECYYCRRGRDNHCEHVGSESIPAPYWGPGGFSELFLARGYEVYRISDHVDPAIATLAEPLACVIHSIDKGQVALGDAVLVSGAGVMGILHLLLARMRGARVLVSETDPGRRRQAMEFGADAAIDPLTSNLAEVVRGMTNGHGVETVFFTAGGKAAIQDGIAALTKGGSLVVYGATKAEDMLSLDPKLLHYNEICLTGVSKHTRDTFRRAAELLSSGQLPLDRLISRRFRFADIVEAFEGAGRLDAYRTVVEMAVPAAADA